MRFPEYNPPNIPQENRKEKILNIAQEAREQAIQKLQKDLAENKPTTPKVRKARLEALIKLLESTEKDKHGELVTGDMMHYSEPAANEPNMGGTQKAA